jgi:carotenoid cleavage dioxygenase
VPLTRRHFLHHALAAGTVPLLNHPGAGAVPIGWPESRFLEGNFFPVHEETAAADLKVVGTLPKELDGLFVRNGPNPQFAPIGKYHWFDGDGMVHAVRIRDGKADYRNRYVRTAGFAEEKKAGKALYTGLLEPRDLKKVAAGEPLFKNAANTSLAFHAGKLLAQWEAGEPHALTVPDLDTVGPHTFGGKLKHPWSAHPKLDPETGELFGYGYDIKPPFVSYSVVDPKGALVRTATVDVKRPTMMHDFALTANYLIFPEQPQTFDLKRAIAGKMPWHFDPKLPTRFGLVPRSGRGDTVWFTAEPGYFFHTLNAFEDGDTVVLVACRFARFPDALALGGDAPDKTPNAPVLYRWTFDLKSGAVKEGPIDDAPSEFPRINERTLGRKMRYGYVGEAAGDLFDGYRKFDLQKNTAERHRLGDGRFGGEAVFVPHPEARAEDAGWLLTFVFDKGTEKSELLVLDACDFAAKPVARVQLPRRVPYGFHGTWVPGAALG